MVSFLHILLLTGYIVVINGQYDGRPEIPHIPDRCARMFCPQVTCLNARTPPGECCPVCPTLPPICARTSCLQPDCPNPITPPGACCPVCPIRPPSWCRNVRCARPVGCLDTYIPDGQCCPVCRRGRQCYYKGVTRDDGESFRDRCNTCTCNNGQVSCTKIGCISKPGRCPRSTGFEICVNSCTDDYDCRGSQKCCSNGCGRTCRRPVQGGGNCLGIVCPQIRCANQYTPPGECCPTCGPIEY